MSDCQHEWIWIDRGIFGGWGYVCLYCGDPDPFPSQAQPIEGERINEVDTGRTYRWTGTEWQPTEGDNSAD